jgi:hypothetical protein
VLKHERINGGRRLQVCSITNYSFDKLTSFPGSPKLVPRVLDVEKGQLCYIVGTVYMDMPLKPNVMEDIARDVRTLVEAFVPLSVLILRYPALHCASTAALEILFCRG